MAVGVVVVAFVVAVVALQGFIVGFDGWINILASDVRDWGTNWSKKNPGEQMTGDEVK